jgi:4a-hydroxytetrahydrobiopterin dehydratase
VRDLLDGEGLAAALALLPDWEGGPDRISRTIWLEPHDDEVLRTQIDLVAAEIDHHPVVEETDQGTRFVLWTHSRGGVTEMDVALAARIDALHADLSRG